MTHFQLESCSPRKTGEKIQNARRNYQKYRYKNRILHSHWQRRKRDVGVIDPSQTQAK